ncbi:phosphoglycerate mutase family domain-containing protein [Gaeumannomyces tritici R3-111a-1]|uniref:Phosphoglycerate mutase family domain-containing protein n=1 Tax=Gaeumannomyces tritici (strain R3-111a-1) TaxID=644352 RepID=J3NYG5_GAET3|nr:phosphoglycerate mutase family domain-containing protein [Gaeumannomyces tritici R3-111a-1]EJT76398.1 phosphoglycerate mutase family domain-containing protein [Gaeumannomyces tritici R3-111a-1]
MAKPRLIILIRHAQSEGNKKREIHQTIPDHRVKLTQDGWQQAYDAGRRLRSMLRADDTLHFFTSPYRRTRETTEGILATLTADEPEPSAFKRNNIKVYEEPRLREQDFGNFQPCSAEMERMWQERADYGHFFYRIPNGESAADAYDRVSGFNESLWRQFGDDDFASVCVLVTHGLMSRVFLMKWYHFSVEYFEDLRNVNHCEFLIMRRREDSGKYLLENKLRTWSELRRDRELAQKEKEREKERDKERDAKDSSALARLANNGANSSTSSLIARSEHATTAATTAATAAATSSPSIPARKWGGCPNGCTHDKGFKIRSGFADLVRRDGTAIYSNPSPVNSSRPVDEPKRSQQELASSSDLDSAQGNPSPAVGSIKNNALQISSSSSSIASSLASRRPNARRFQSDVGGSSGSSSLLAPSIDVTRARDEVVSSPDGTPSFISVDVRLRSQIESPNNNKPPPRLLHVGRDFGGTYSGHTSDADSSEDESTRERIARLSAAPASSTDDINEQGTSAVTDGASGDVTAATTPAEGSVVGDCGTAKEAASASHRRDISGMGRGAYANRLGDAPHCDHHDHDHDHSEAEHGDHELSDNERIDHQRCHKHDTPAQPQVKVSGVDDRDATQEDLDEAEREDKSLRGSVY